MIQRLPFDLLVIFIIFVLSASLGLKIFHKLFNFNFDSRGQGFFFSVGFGLILFSYLVFILGFFKLLHNYVFILIAVVLTFLCSKEIKFVLKSLKLLYLQTIKLKPETKFDSFLLKVLLICIVSNLLFAYSPPLQVREMMYDLSLPRRYVMEHQIFNMPDNYTSHYPLQIQMIYTLIMNFGDGISAKLFHYFLGILNMFLVYFITRKLVDKRVALLSATLFYLMPMTTSHSGVGNIEFGYFFYGLLTVLALLNWTNEENINQWFYLATINAGSAFATKLPGISVVITALFFTVYLELFRKKRSIFDCANRIFIFGAIIGLIYSPWLIKNYLFTSNPFYPMNLFGFPVHEEIILQKIVFYISNQGYDLLRKLNQHHDLLFGIFVHGPGPLIFPFVIPWLFMKKEKKNLNLIFLFAGLNFLILYFLLPRPWIAELRYYFVSYTLFCIISAYSILTILNKFNIKKFVYFLILLGLIFPCLSLSVYFGLKRIPLFLGIQSKNDYIKCYKHISYDLVEFVNKNLKKNDRVLSIGAVYENDYYFIPRIIYSDLYIRGITDIKRVISELRKNNITHIIFHKSNFRKLDNGKYIQKSNNISSVILMWDIEKYSNEHFELLYTDNQGTQLYKVKRDQ